MRTIGLDDVTDEALSSEERIVTDMIRTRYPRLDLRAGTALRDLLVLPDAAVGAAFSLQAEEQRNCSSLARMEEAEENGTPADRDDVSAVLSNFNMEPVSGTKASGSVRVSVKSARTYTVAKGSVFSTPFGLEFASTASVVAALPDVQVDGDRVDLRVDPDGGYWFLVPVECTQVGEDGNIGPGTRLTPDFSMFGLVSASAYRLFSGGSDMEPLKATVGRIRRSLSMRGLLTRDSVEAVLRDRFDSTGDPVVAVSLCGYGSEAQRRDRHNAFGVSVGGRVDAYVRNFTSLPVTEVTKPGTDNGDGTYTVCVEAREVPGMYCVYRVTNPSSDAVSSYAHSEEWVDCGSSSTWHDFDVSSSPDELMGTVWRGVRVRVEADADSDAGLMLDDSGAPLFRVELVRLPRAAEIQAVLDDDAVRALGTDFVVRCPVVVQVSVNAVVRRRQGDAFDRSAAVEKICEYINTSGFVGRITRSEIASLLIGCGAASVDLHGTDEMLSGYGYRSDGLAFRLRGDALDVSDVPSGARSMVCRETCVFSVEPSNVVIKTMVV